MEKYTIRLRAREHHIDAYIRGLSVVEDVRVRNRLILDALPAGTELTKYIHLDETEMVLDSGVGAWVVRTVYEKAQNGLELESRAESIHSQKNVDGLQNTAELDSDAAAAVQELYAACENALELFAHDPVKGELTMLFGASAELLLESGVDGTHAAKTIAAEEISELTHAVAAVLEALCAASGTEIEMSSAAAVSMTMYRRIFEMDSDGGTDFYLSDFDNLDLEEIDYVVID